MNERDNHTEARRAQRWACPRWCDFRDVPGHPGPHAAAVDEIQLARGPAYTVAVWAVDAGAGRTACELTIGQRAGTSLFGRAVMSWPQAHRLAQILDDGHARFGTVSGQ